jgi:hypothetical protein
VYLFSAKKISAVKEDYDKNIQIIGTGVVIED